MSAREQIFVQGPNWVGDAIMATPALRALRAGHPEARISLAAPRSHASLYAGLDSVDRFIPTERGIRATLRLAAALRAAATTAALLFPDSPRAALAPFLARVPRRIGYAREPLRRALLTHPLAPPSRDGRRLPIPMGERYLAITRAFGCEDRGDALELAVDPNAAQRMSARLTRAGIPAHSDYFVVAPGARFGPSKLWPAEHFAAASDEIARRTGLTAVIATAADEHPIARRVADAMSQRCVVLAEPATDLDDLKALIDRARLLLCNDSGARQVAVARARPVVVLMGPTDPRHTAQHLSLQRVLHEDVDCRPCQLANCPIDHRCMTRLAPERAVAAALELLA